MEHKPGFVACDMPGATAFMINVYAAVAPEERRMIGDQHRWPEPAAENFHTAAQCATS